MSWSANRGGSDNAEFEAFYRRMAPSAERYARTILGRRAAGELDEALQSAWSSAWSNWGVSDDERREPWMLRIVRNSCLDRHRRLRRTGPTTDVVDLPSAEDVAIDRAQLDAIYDLLGTLNPKLREVLWLREVEGLSYADIAEVQSIPVGTVMSRLYAARRRAARMLRSRR